MYIYIPIIDEVIDLGAVLKNGIAVTSIIIGLASPIILAAIAAWMLW